MIAIALLAAQTALHTQIQDVHNYAIYQNAKYSQLLYLPKCAVFTIMTSAKMRGIQP